MIEKKEKRKGNLNVGRFIENIKKYKLCYMHMPCALFVEKF